MAVLPSESWGEMDPDLRWRACPSYEAPWPPGSDPLQQWRAAGDADRAIREVLLASYRFPPGFEAGRGWEVEAPETPAKTGPVERYRGLIVLHWSGKPDRLAAVLCALAWVAAILTLIVVFCLGYSVGAGQPEQNPTPVITELPGG